MQEIYSLNNLKEKILRKNFVDIILVKMTPKYTEKIHENKRQLPTLETNRNRKIRIQQN